MTPRTKTLLTLVSGVAIAVFLAISLIAFYSVGPKLPRLNVDDRTFDFGEADVNTSIECSFRIHNTGNASLLIHDIRTDCSCSNAEIDKKDIPKGQSASIRVSYHTPDHGGIVSSNILVETNAPDSRFLHLRVVGTVRPQLQIVPAVLDFGDIDVIDKYSTPTRVATVYTWSSTPVSLEKIHCPEKWLTVSFTPEKTNQRILGYLKVRVCSDPPQGENKAQLEVMARSGNEAISSILTILVDIFRNGQ